MYVYIESERWTDDNGRVNILYTVGHYGPGERFIPESDHNDEEEAAARVHYLNGGNMKNWSALVAAATKAKDYLFAHLCDHEGIDDRLIADELEEILADLA